MRPDWLSVCFVATLSIAAGASRAAMPFGSDGGTDQLATVSPADGTVANIGPLGKPSVDGLAFDDSGTLFGIDSNTESLLTIDPATGAATTVGSFGVDAFPGGLAYDPGTGDLFSNNNGKDELLRIDPATGTATQVLSIDHPDDLNLTIEGLDFDPHGRLRAIGANSQQLMTIDPDSGTVTGHVVVDEFDVSTHYYNALAFDAGGELFVADSSPDELLRVNPGTGAVLDRHAFTQVGDGPVDTGNSLGGLAFTPGTSARQLANADFSGGAAFWRTLGPGSVSSVDVDGDTALELSTDTDPLTLSQSVGTGDGLPLEVRFDFRFLTEAGSLDLMLGDTVLATLDKDGVAEPDPLFFPEPLKELDNGFLRLVGVADPNPLNRPEIDELAFRLNPGSLAEVQLDNVGVQAIPEPASLALLGLGGLALLWRR